MLVVDKMLFSKIKNINSVLIQVFEGELIICQRSINNILFIFDLILLILSNCQKKSFMKLT